MKSRFFTDEQGLDTTPDIPGKICVCLLVRRSTLQNLLRQAQKLGMTSGEYIDHLMGFSGRGTTKPSPSYSPPRRFPPAPPDH